ncbi:MAG: dihydroorotate dehydrogenase-like protein [Candidatus Synoicihabitans palmerolidicus]|nr:dihydroorotate dehydrogenase-like protein [Candidatus Synoicihabitans palmerolidicus]
MNLKTTYLGLPLKNPFVIGVSPFCDNLTVCRELVSAGAAAIVMHSFFEEQVEAKSRALRHSPSTEIDRVTFPAYEDYRLDSEQYLRQLSRLRQLVEVPIIASLNGHNVGNWAGQAQRMEDAGAAGIELNLYHVAADPSVPADEIESSMLQLVRTVSAFVKVPVAVKILSSHTSPVHFAAMLNENGAAGLVVFNRFYQADIDPQTMQTVPRLRLSDSSDLLLRLRWLSILSPEFPGALACSGGVHTGKDAVKAVLAGADVVQVVSALLKRGAPHVETMITEFKAWMAGKEYRSVDQFRGALDMRRCIDPGSHERADYLQALQAWRV